MKSPPNLCHLKRVLLAMAEGQVPGAFGIEVGALTSFEGGALFAKGASTRSRSLAQRGAAFRSGRACVREALKSIGYAAVAIDSGASGEPLWPAGCVGSISHTGAVAAAVVARSPPMRGIGIDMEGNEPLNNADMLELVCRPEELIARSDPSQSENLRRGKLIFVIKEAIYKLYWPMTRTFLEFHDVSVMVDVAAGVFIGELVDRRLARIANNRLITGRFAEVEGLYVALASSRF